MKEILTFLTELSCNNNREWFNEHKDWYRDCQQRFELFTAQWLERLAEMDPDLAALQPKDCIWRIYRDVRFSPDKRPFKEWFGVFPAVKGGKKSDRGGYYIHIQPDRCMFGGGMWCPNKDLLHAVRREILANYDEVESIFSNPVTNKYFQDFDTEYMLKKVPQGFTFSTPLTDEQVCAPDFIDLATEMACAAKPINDFLNYTFEEYGEFPDRR